MGKDIHYSIFKFFEDKLKQHSKVLNFEKIDTDNDVVYRIVRISGLPDIHVHLSDAYSYSDYDYLSKPSIIGEGDYIMIAKPEASFGGTEFGVSRRDKIGFGKIGAFLGALNYRNVWEYETSYEREEKKKNKNTPKLF